MLRVRVVGMDPGQVGVEIREQGVAVPESVRHMTVRGAVYRPLAGDAATVELAVAWRRDDDTAVLARALEVVRGDLRSPG